MVKKTDPYLEQTRLIQKVSVVLFALLAVGATMLMNAYTQIFTLGYMVRDQIASQLSGHSVFAPASRNLWEVQTKWLLVTVLVVSAIFSLLHLTRLRTRFDKGVKEGVQPTRWLELGLTAYLMIELTALLSGVTDVMTLKMVAGLVLASAAFAWLAERQNAGQKKPNWNMYVFSLVAIALPLLLLASAAIHTLIYGLIQAPWYVYAVYGILLLGTIGVALNQWLQHRRQKQWKNTSFVERNFALINLVTKILFAVVLILGFKK